MNRASGLFERLCSFENLRAAARRAQRAKRYRPDVLRFGFRQEDRLHELSDALRSGAWRPAGYRHFEVFEPKRRWISAAPYADRVVHHAVCQVVEPELDRRMIEATWANRRGKGSHRAVLRYQALAGRYRYALSMDIRKYFASIDHALLVRMLSRVFKERRLLELLALLVHAGENPESAPAYFPGDDLFALLERPCGLPIGNLTSQVFGNFFLSGFDHWVKEELRAPAYLRFMDDLLFLHDDRSVLQDWSVAVERRLGDVRLRAHPRKRVLRRTSEGVPLLGYVVWPARIRVRGATVRRFRRRWRRGQAVWSEAERRVRLVAWRGHIQLAGRIRRSAAQYARARRPE